MSADIAHGRLSAVFFALGFPIGRGPIEVVVDGPGDLGTEPVAGVVGDPALVLVLVAHDADGHRSGRAFDDPGGRPRVGEAAGLEGDLGSGGSNLGNLSLSSQARRCSSISSQAAGLTICLR